MGVQVSKGWNSFKVELEKIFSNEYVGMTASWVWDKKNDQVFVEYAEKIFGYKSWEDIYSPSYWRRKIHNKDFITHKQTIEKCLNNELSNFEVDLRIRTKYGRYIWLTCKGRVIFNKENNIAQFVGTYTVL